METPNTHEMPPALRATIDKAAREAAASSWDAHGEFVAATIAYEFIAGVWADEELPGADAQPPTMPAVFASDYAQYCRAIQEGNA
jgi:hypothetical protein